VQPLVDLVRVDTDATWSGSSLDDINKIAPQSRLRYALLTPRVAAPHLNQPHALLSGEQAIASLMLCRLSELSRSEQENLIPKRRIGRQDHGNGGSSRPYVSISRLVRSRPSSAYSTNQPVPTRELLPGQNDAAKARFRRKAQQRLAVEMLQQLLEASIGQPFRTVLRDLGLTSNQVWGLAKTDQEWSEKLQTALTATRRNDLRHGTNAAYVQGCVCHECREPQRIRMGRSRG
jgi:hypothetical protein